MTTESFNRLSKADWQNRAVRAAVNLVFVAGEEASMGSVSGNMFDALQDLYHDWKDVDESFAREILAARKSMRQTEWGDDFEPEEFDMPLDPEWAD